MSRKPGRGDLEARLGYRFSRPDLLERALTHVSAAAGETALSNQRLEFLGDRVLGLAVSALLYETHPGASEGELSQRLSGLVRRESCAAMAEFWGLAPQLVLGSGEGKSGGRRKDAILADAAEAVIGAVFLDGGLDPARALVERSLAGRTGAGTALQRDAKTALQEWAQAGARDVPSYAIVGRSGPDHAPRFSVAVRVEGCADAVGEGRSRRAAEQEAARAMLLREGVWTPDMTGADA